MMQKHLYPVTLVLLLALGASPAFAQNTNTATPDAKMSANFFSGARNLDGLYTPNLYNGTLDINVPIYNYQGYGVSLTYNTLGVKVDEYSSEIGTHWQLNTGPTLTRIIRDLPDESYYVTDSIIREEDPLIVNQQMYLKGKLLTYTETPAQQAAPNVYRDSECDEFIFSSSRGKVSFYVGNDFKVFTHPKRNIQVEVQQDTSTFLFGFPGLQIFIKDEDGVQYYFKSGNLTYVKLEGFSDWQWAGLNYEYLYAATQWNVEKVILANGQEINYTYSAFYSGQPDGHQFTLSRGYSVRETWSNPIINQFLGISNNVYNYFSQITGIVYPNDVEVEFAFDNNEKSENKTRMVNAIKVTSGTECLAYNLLRDSVGKRWFLDRMTVSGCNGESEEPLYDFGYYNQEVLPARLNSAIDFFGYYNGDSTGTPIGASGPGITIPKHGTGYGSDRLLNPNFAKAGLLTQIKNAYGGTIDFFYGLPAASGQLTSLPTDNNFMNLAMTSGLRIDSIIKTDKYYPNNKWRTLFTYSGGQLFLTGGYFHFPEYIDSVTGTWKRVIFQDKFLTAHQLINGANHGYSSVSVKEYVNSALASRTDYTFTNFKDATSNNQPRYYKVPGSKHYYEYPYTDKQYIKDWEMGLPLTITEFDQNNRIVGKVLNTYSFSNVDLSAASYIENKKVAKVGSGTGQQAFGSGWIEEYYPYKYEFSDTYYPYTGTANLVRSVKQKFVSDNQYIADTVVYSYDNKNNINTLTTTNSLGEKFQTEYVYNYAVDGPGVPIGYTQHPGTTLYNMTADGLEKVVATQRWTYSSILTQPPTPPTLIEASITGFRYEDGKLLPKSLWNTAIVFPLSYFQYTGLAFPSSSNPYGKILDVYNSSGDIEFLQNISVVTLVDDDGNPTEIQHQSENHYESKIYDRASGKVLAEASNCRFTDIAYCSFEGSLSGSNLVVAMGQLYTPSPGNAVTGERALSLWMLGYPTGSPLTINGAHNLQAGKEYLLTFWSKGANPSVKIGSTVLSLGTPVYTKGSWKNYVLRFTPSVASKISITGTASTSVIDELRLHPADAQMQSRTYKPLVGVSSETDAAGRVTYYEYDYLGRLVIIRNQEGHVLSKKAYNIGQ